MKKVSEIEDLDKYIVGGTWSGGWEDDYIKVVLLVRSRRDFDASPEGPDWATSRMAVDNVVKGYRRTSVLLDPGLQNRKIREKARLSAIFVSAQLGPIHMREIKNRCCGDPCCYDKPWFIVTSYIGPIKVGDANGILVIDWSDSDVKGRGKEIFPGEDVTVEDYYIHAWNSEQAISFLMKLRDRFYEESKDGGL